MESKGRPVIVAMIQVSNDAWILRAFLEATSLWADYIVIVIECQLMAFVKLLMNIQK